MNRYFIRFYIWKRSWDTLDSDFRRPSWPPSWKICNRCFCFCTIILLRFQTYHSHTHTVSHTWEGCGTIFPLPCIDPQGHATSVHGSICLQALGIYHCRYHMPSTSHLWNVIDKPFCAPHSLGFFQGFRYCPPLYHDGEIFKFPHTGQCVQLGCQLSIWSLSQHQIQWHSLCDCFISASIVQGSVIGRPVATGGGAFWGRAPPLKLSAPPLKI